MTTRQVTGHAGQQAIAAMMAFGTDVMFTLNGGHIWPLYEAARDQGMRVVDTRHEQTATFARRGLGEVDSTPGLAALTAGPGITNGVSAITTAMFNGSPLVVMGGRAPELRWGSGSLQEMDAVPIVSSITKSAATVKDASRAGAMVHAAAQLALTPHHGPTFLDFPLDVFGPSSGELPELDEGVGRGEPAVPRGRRRPGRRDRRRPSGRRSSSAATSTGEERGRSWPRPPSICACRASSTGSDAARSPRITSWRSCGPADC